MKKFIYIIVLLSLAICSPISESRALDIAENFFNYRNNPETSTFSVNSIDLYSSTEQNIFYIIKLDPDGFILISADNLIKPILGYSFENNYSNEDLPVNIQYLFNLYTEELIEQIETRELPEQEILDEWEYFLSPLDYEPSSRSVSPLLLARFDQGSAWNDMCPEDPDGPGGNALVGCVAVSMAQVMHYWSYPEVGYGTHGYNHWDYGYQYADFGNAYYDYSDMPNNYATEETQELLYHCGVAVNMGYGADGSGAQVFGSNPSTEFAMKNYFLFQDNLDNIYPEQYSTAQYRNLLQNELNNNRPIIYVGYSNDGGHAWNIDGYEDDYFHNNWGWGGSQNGYFLLSSLNGFNSSQGALIEIEPESLNNPNIVLQSYTYEELDGDGDLVVNPGETINLFTQVENLIPWNDALNIDIILSTEDPSLNIINDYVTFTNLDAGSSYMNNNDPFIVEFDEDISFDIHQLQLNILAFGSNGEYNENEYYIDVEVSLDQIGFPYSLTLLDDNNQPYNAMTIVQSSPLLIDIDNDGYSEIFFGDDGGYFHGVDYQGNSLEGFPIQLDGTSAEIWGAPCADDIDNDGEIEIVFTSKNKHCYIVDASGNIELAFESDQYLMATPSILNIDNDNDLEIVFYGYTTSGDIHVINHNGTYVDNFPVQINEKILKGGAIYDINNNGKDDIIVATENEKLISVIYDDGTISNLFNSNDKFKSPPSIIDYNGQTIITAGDEGGNFYGINTNGTLQFTKITGNNIRSSAGFIEIDNDLGIFFGSEDGYLYGIDINGNNLEGWPQEVIGGATGNIKINSSPIFADLDNDNNPEIITASEEGQLIIYNLDGTPYSNFPINYNYGFISSPTILDLDNDNDLEIIIGTNQNLSVIDIKNITESYQDYWYTYQGDINRTGSYIFNGSIHGDVNYDGNVNVQDIVITLNMILGEIEPSISADLNSDGIVNVLDVVILVNIILD